MSILSDFHDVGDEALIRPGVQFVSMSLVKSVSPELAAELASLQIVTTLPITEMGHIALNYEPDFRVYPSVVTEHKYDVTDAEEAVLCTCDDQHVADAICAWLNSVNWNAVHGQAADALGWK